MNECANILQVKVDSRRVDKLKGNEGRRVAIDLPGKLYILTSVCYTNTYLYQLWWTWFEWKEARLMGKVECSQ